MMYDGYYAICTDLVNDSVEEIIRVSEQRWEIEESFRIMKTEFQARPVYLSREDRIQAHFLICYLSLMIYRILEKAERKIHSRKDHHSTKKNGITYHPRNGISAFLYKN